jgi:DNA-binding CsgD family transcriptional regulator
VVGEVPVVPFVGRRAELAALCARLAEVGNRIPHVVQIEGPAGIGKTALIENFLAAAGTGPQPVVLRSSGEETETLLPYGVIEQLARSAGRAGRDLRDAVTPTLGDGEPEPLEDAISVGTRLLALLDRLESGRPVVLVVDDAQWADAPSLQALIFALRRLVADPVLAVVAVRDDGADLLPASLRRLVTGHRGSELRLRGLGDEDLRSLAAGLGIDRFPVSAVRRLRHGTQGNPLHATAVLEEFPPGEWGAGQRPLPSPRSFRLLVRDRYAACAPATRRLLDAAAVLGLRCPLPLAAALAEVPEPLVAVDDAGVHGLLSASGARQPWMVAFPHPLVRSAIYDALGAAPRSALHLRAAELVAAAGPSDGGAAGAEGEQIDLASVVLRHRVSAAVEPDATLAADLERFADREARRQSWPSAVAHLVEASRLSPDRRGDGQTRLLRAVNWLLQNGDAAGAAAFADEVAGFEPGPLRDSVLGSLAMATGDPATAESLLASAWKACSEDTDPETAATIAFQNAVHRYGRLDGPGSALWCERALALTGPDTTTRWAAQTYLAHGLGYSGRAAESFAAAAGAEERPGDPPFAWLEPRSARGLLRLVDDDLDGAREDLASAAATASRLGVLNTAAYAFAFLARAEYLAGAWDDAVLHAERAVAINEESDLAFTRSMVLGVAALVPAGRGEWAAAQAAIDAADVGDYERSVVAIAMSRARLAEARGDRAAVLAALDPVRRFPDRAGANEPGFWAWADLYAEALAGVGRHDEADELLRPHETRAAERGRLSSIARLARARGRVEAAAGRPDRADAAFAQALEAVDRVPFPFDRARTRLAAGAFHRRAGRRRRAVDLLVEAQEGFAALGAEPYVERCDKELAASGLDPAARRNRDRAGLTSQELVVARLAAAGRSNRDLAAELVVSVKTVEYHLRNAFQKLGVTSRRQLAGRLEELVDG